MTNLKKIIFIEILKKKNKMDLTQTMNKRIEKSRTVPSLDVTGLNIFHESVFQAIEQSKAKEGSEY